ncbi:MAG: hypothetical protein ABIY51_07030 [Ferruginibacter sp.]
MTNLIVKYFFNLKLTIMEAYKKDDSVKTGLEIEAHKVTKAGAEKDAESNAEQDADDLVHQQLDDAPDTSNETDIDELVHENTSTSTNNELEERDPDDMIHENKTEGEE